MSMKGNKHTAIAKRKIGLANAKDRAIIDKKAKEYIQALTDDDFPSLTDCALYIGIAEKNLVLYESGTEEESNIRKSLDEIRDRQKSYLMHNGLKRKIDGRLTGLLLEANHSMKKDPTSLVQNNTFNVPADLLAEALEITRQKQAKIIKAK